MAAKRRRPGTGSVRQLPSGRWQARYQRPGHGSWVTAPQTFDSKLDASAWLDHWSARGFDVPVEVPVEDSPDPLLADYAAVWLRDRDLSPRTRAHYRKLLDTLIVPTFGATTLSAITPTAVRAWHAGLDRDKATTRAHAYGLLRAICSTAVRDGLIPANPCRVENASKVERKHRTRPASLDELAAIVAAMPERYRAMVLLAAWCGLRFGELTELRRGDLDLEDDRGVVHVRRGVVRVGSEYVVGTPKTAAGVRSVSVPPHRVPVLQPLRLGDRRTAVPGGRRRPPHGPEHAGEGLHPSPGEGREARPAVPRPQAHRRDVGGGHGRHPGRAHGPPGPLHGRRRDAVSARRVGPGCCDR